MSRKRLIQTVKHTTGMGTEHVAKVHRSVEYNEYRVTFFMDGYQRAETEYFTSDKQDALDTATRHIERISQQFA